MKKLIFYPLALSLFLAPIKQSLAQDVPSAKNASPIVVAQIGYTVGTVEMVEDHGFDPQGGAFRGIFLFQGRQYVAWYYSRPNVSIGRHLRLTYLDQPGGNWYSLYDPATDVTAYVTAVKPI